MITEIKYLEDDDYCFTEGEKFKLKPLTLLVGDQGCGKSTLLRLLENKPDYINFTEDINPLKLVQKIDFDKDTLDKQQGNPYSSQDMLAVMTSKYLSHGENVLPIVHVLNESKDTLILLDEPETALSPRSIYFLIETIEKALTRNNQIIIATHNVMLMQHFNDCILSLEHKKYMSYSAFLKSQQFSNDFKEKRNDRNIKLFHCIQGINCKCAAETNWYNQKCEFAVKRGMTKKDVLKLAKQHNIKI